MDILDVFRLSAEACRGRFAETGSGIYVMGSERWNPFTNAEQRWECYEKLMELNCSIDAHREGTQVIFDLYGEGDEVWHEDCPVNEIFPRALAEIQSRRL